MLSLLTYVLSTVNITLKLTDNTNDKDYYDLKVELSNFPVYGNLNDNIWFYDLSVHEYKAPNICNMFSVEGKIDLSRLSTNNGPSILAYQRFNIEVLYFILRNSLDSTYKMTLYVFMESYRYTYCAEINTEYLLDKKQLFTQATQMNYKEAKDYRSKKSPIKEKQSISRGRKVFSNSMNIACDPGIWFIIIVIIVICLLCLYMCIN